MSVKIAVAIGALLLIVPVTSAAAQSSQPSSTGAAPQMTPPPVSKQPGVTDPSKQAPVEGRDSTSSSEAGGALANPPSLPGEQPGVNASRDAGRMPAGR